MKTTKTRRPKGEGSFTRLPNGTYKMTITIGRTPDGRQVRKSVSAKTKKDLMQKVAEARLAVGHLKSSTSTLKEVLKAYVSHHENTLTYNTLMSWEEVEKLLGALGDMRIDKIHPEHIDNFLDSLVTRSGKKYSQGSLRFIKSKIASLYNFALERDIISFSPIPKTKKRMTTKRADTLVIPTELEIQRLLKEFKERSEHFLYPLCLLAVSTGMRLGELLGLEVTDIDIKTSSIKVSHQCTLEGTRKPLKTSGSYRTIYVDTEVLKVVLEECKDNSRLFNVKYNGGKRIARELKRIEWLPKGFTFHCFRHYHATQLLLKGIDIKEVSKRLGHTSIKTTLDLYVHWVPEVDQKASKLLGEQFIV